MTVAPAVPAAAAARSAGPSHRRIGEKWYTGYLFIAPHLLFFVLMTLLSAMMLWFMTYLEESFMQFVSLK